VVTLGGAWRPPLIRDGKVIKSVHFLSRERKRNQKKAPVPRFFLRVAASVGARGNSPACGGLKQSAHFLPTAPSMLGAGQREIRSTLQ